MAKRDHYDVLGVARTASADEIRKAYRKLAREFHPDVNKSADAQKKFTEVQAAYDILSDEPKRKMYDQFGHAEPRQGGPAGGAPGGGAHYTWTNVAGGGMGPDLDADDLGSMFEAFFGGRGGAGAAGPGGFGGASGARGRARRARPQPGPSPVEHELSITFMTAARGGKETLRLIEDGQTRTVEVTIPKGVAEGARLRVGDVLLKVRVGHHPLFRRSEVRDGPEAGLDLFLDLPLTIAEATLGARVSVPSLDGSVELVIPPGTSSGRKLRARGQGIADAKGTKGDLYAITKIVVPEGAALAPADAEALRRISAAAPAPRLGEAWPPPRP